MRKMFITVIFLAVCGISQAASWYLSPGGNGSDGKSFATAWKDFSAIRNLSAGDTVYIGAGTYNSAPRVEVNGIVFRKSRLSGYDGPVVINCVNGAQWRFWAQNITLDGVDRNTFTIRMARQDGNPVFYVGYWGVNASGTIIKNVTFQGVNTQSTWAGVGMNIYSDGVTLQDCRFIGNPGEDQLGMMQGGLIERCEFSGQTDSNNGAIHRDIISIDPGPKTGQTLTIRDSYFHDSTTDTIIMLTSGGNVYGTMEIIGNTFWNLDTCLKWDTRNPTNSNTKVIVKDNRWGNASIWFAGKKPSAGAADFPFIQETGTVVMNTAPVWPPVTSPTVIPTSVPTVTPMPTSTPIPTSTPVPTATNTPKPTATPIPTSTPKPTSTPTMIPTPTPNPIIIRLPAGEYKIKIEGAVEISK